MNNKTLALFAVSPLVIALLNAMFTLGVSDTFLGFMMFVFTPWATYRLYKLPDVK